MGQKFCGNRSISLHFQDKQVFVFNAEIQDGCQKWQENNFWEKSEVDSADTLWVKSFLVKVASRLATYPTGQKIRRNRSISLCFQDERFFAFNAEIQDGRQN